MSTATAARIEKEHDKGIKHEGWTTERLIDEFYLHLMNYEIQTDKETGRKRSKYEHAAEDLIYRIPVYQPVPSFIVNMNDLTDKLNEELRNLDDKSLNEVMKQAIGRIFENINERYFKLSVKKLLKCELKE
jgi:hypothetical protein